MLLKNAILLNDTSKEHHVGCSQVIRNIQKVCQFNNIQISHKFTRQQILNDPRVSAVAKSTDLIIVNGEGSLHHSPECTSSLLGLVSGVKPKILINSVWEKMFCCKHLLEKFFCISVRESLSFREIGKVTSTDKVTIVPDMIFYGIDLESHKLGYSDCVLPYVSSTLRTRGNYFPLQTKASSPDILAYITWLRGLELFVTGRFHGVCLAMMLGVPFLAFPSNSFKIEGLLEDCGCPELLINDFSEVERKRDVAVQAVEKTRVYSDAAKSRIEAFFEHMRKRLDS